MNTMEMDFGQLWESTKMEKPPGRRLTHLCQNSFCTNPRRRNPALWELHRRGLMLEIPLS